MNPDSTTERRHPRLKTRLKELARDQILAGAEEAFAAEGLHGTRMETIARRVGVAVGTLYNHFKDRDALFHALLEARRDELFSRVDRAIEAGARLAFEKQLELFFSAFFDHLEQHLPFMGVVIEGENGAGAHQKKMMQELRKRTSALVGRGVRAGTLRPTDVDLFGPMLLGIVKVAMLRRVRGEDTSPRLHDQIPRLIRFFLHGAASAR